MKTKVKKFRFIAKIAQRIACLTACFAFSASAASVAKVGETEYDTLETAIQAATPDANGVIEYQIFGKAEISSTGWVQVVKPGLSGVSKVAFVGKTEDAEICIAGGVAILADKSYDLDVSFENLKLSKLNPQWAGDYGHGTNYFTTWLRNSNAAENTVTYKNCTFPNGVCNNQYGKTIFTGCTFENTTGGLFNMWVYGGAVEMSACAFSGKRGMKVYTEGAPANAPTVDVKDTSFTGLSEKAAIVVSKAATVALAGVSVTGCQKGAFQKDIEGSTAEQKVTLAANGTGLAGTFAITENKDSEEAKNEFNVSAGTFTAEVPADYCAEGFTVKATTDASGNTVYGVVAADPRTLGYAVSGTAAELPAAPDMSGAVVNVTAAQAQYVLDGAYGSIDGKTINFTESVADTLVIGRASKYEGSGTLYRHGSHDGEAMSYADFIAYKNQAYYERTVANVTFTADADVIVNFTAEGGAHVYGTKSAPIYDYVRDTGTWTFDTNNGFFKRATLKNLTFKGLTFTAKTNFETSEATTVFDGFTFTGCTFETGISTDDKNQALRYYDEYNNGNLRNLVVENCTFKNCYHGIYTGNAKGVTVKGCTFETVGYNAIAVQSQGVCDYGTVVITGNTFKDIANRIIRFNEVGSGTTITIADNTADGNSGKLDSATGKREIVAAVSLPENVAEIISASNNDWGANAVAGDAFADTKPVAALIGTVSYETLDAAIAAVKDGETVVVNAGEYKLNGSLSYAGKAFTIKAAEGAKVSFDMSAAVALHKAKITFEGVTFDYKTNNDYTGLQHADTLVYNDCTINGKVFLYATSETFNRCVFNQSAVDYNVWTYGAQKVAFNACTFNCAGKSVFVYNEGNGATQKTDLTVTACEFKASAGVTGKAAIEIDTSLMKGDTSVTIDDQTTATGFATGSNSGSTLWNDKKQTKDTNKNVTVTVAGETVFAPAVAKIGEAGYSTLAEALAAAQDGETVTLLADVNGDGIVVPANAFPTGLVVDFAGHTYTVSGRLVGSSTTESNAFQLLAGNKITFKNGSLVGATATAGEGTDWTGAPAILIQNYCDLTLERMTVKGGDETCYTLSNNNGDIVIADSTIVAGRGRQGPFAFDVCRFSSYPSVRVTVKGDSVIDGNVEVSGTIGEGQSRQLDIEGGTFKGTFSVANQPANIAISGGTFSTAVLPEYCAAGFIPAANGDGTFGVKEGAFVAAIGDVKYETLAEAIAAAKASKTVMLIADTRENVIIDKRLTLDLNGFTLNGGTVQGKAALTVNAARVTIKDSSEAKTGMIKREDTAANSGMTSYYVLDIQGKEGFVLFEGGTVINDSGTTDGARKGASLVRIGDDSVSAYPQLTIKGGTFTQNNFVAIKVDRGTFFLTGGTINCPNDEAVKNWGAATIKGGTVNGTVASWVYADSKASSTLTISDDATINGNVYAMSYDGAEGKTAKVSITGGYVTDELGTYQGKNIHEKTALSDAEKASIGVTGGRFTKDPSAYLAEDSTAVKGEDEIFSVQKAYLAKIGDTYYYTMDEAFHAANASEKIETIVLLRDYTTTALQNSGSKGFTLDLNGKTWTCKGSDANSAAFEINYPNVTLTVKNGKVVSDQLLGLIPSAMGGTITYDNAALVFEEVEATVNGRSGIETNGNNTNNSITLKGCSLTVADGYGIYFPSSGTLTIEDSVIVAKTMGVQVCAGTLSISGASKITVTGDAVAKVGNDGAIEDGAAVSVVNRMGYKALEKIVLAGGTFTAKAGNTALKAYAWANGTESAFDNAMGTITISGGTFSSAVLPEYCAAGFIPAANGDGTFGVKEGAYVAAIGDVKYETLEAALAAAKDGETVKMLADALTVEATKTGVADRLTVNVNLTLDLNGHTLTTPFELEPSKNWASFYITGGSLTVKDSVGNGGIRSGDKDHLGTYLFHLNGGNLIVESGNFFGGCTIANVQAGTATIKDGRFEVCVSGGEDSRYLLNCIDASYKAGTAHVVVIGGTFVGYDPRNNAAEGPATNFVAPGVGVDADENGVFTAKPNMCAQITDADGNSVTAHETLQAAFDAAKKGDTVTLLSDITLTEQVNITKALDGLTLDGNDKTITCATTDDPLKGGGSALYFGNANDKLYCTGIAIKNLTMTGKARFAIFLCGGKSTTFTKVKISGNYYIAINLYGTHGATMTDCDISNSTTGTDKYISAIWSNVASANPLTLNNTKVNIIAINEYTTANKLEPKIYVNAGSTVDEIHTFDDGAVSGDTRLCVGDSPVMPSVKIYDETDKTWIDAPAVVFVKALIGEEGKVTLPDTLLEKVAGATRFEKFTNLSKADANGNLAWVNLVAGIDPAKKVTMIAPQNDDADMIGVKLPTVGTAPAGTDVTVLYEIRAEGSDAAVVSATAAEDLVINLNGKAGIGTYRAYVCLLQNGTEVARVASENKLGILQTVSAAKKTIIAVPWLSLTADGNAIAVADLVKTAGLTAGDKLHVYNKAESRYDVYELAADMTWMPKAIYKVGADGTVEAVSSGTPETTTVARGNGVWLERQDTTQPIVSYGQVASGTVATTIDAGTAEKAAWNLLAVPTTTAVNIETTFGASEADTLIVPTDGAPKVCTVKNGEWGYAKSVPVTDASGNQLGVRVVREKVTELPAGTGFWYLNGGAAKTVNW